MSELGYKVMKDSSLLKIQATGEGFEHAFIEVQWIGGSDRQCEYDEGALSGQCPKMATHRTEVCDAPELTETPDIYAYCWHHASLQLGIFICPTGD